ncbi:hypothetical protein [Georgenia sp. H159]|uniref:adenosine deaminase family protein n=1 Tax=Georgenia sp. H159 TaxID=3076115 RepID=UPI002D774B32|nr:hypothetical protein [Georgenia sp. H159]
MTLSPAYAEYLRRMPKVDLHVHLTGTVRAETFAELAEREGLQLPEPALDIYAKVNSRAKDLSIYRDAVLPVPTGPGHDEPEPSYGLFQVSQWVKQCLTNLGDYERIAYEACENAATLSNTRHLELFFDPVADTGTEFGYAETVDAYIAGIQAAERDFGMTARLVAGIDRSQSGEAAVERVRTVVDNPRAYVIGIGLDNLETAGPPERFVDAYQLARAHGLRRTAHSSEHAPSAQNTIVCLDDLACDRIDHGYFILQDEAVVERCLADQVPFTCIFTTSRRAWRPWRRASIREMVGRGLKVTLASDDPGMFPTTLAQEYRIAAEELGFDRATMRRLCLNGVDASWLPDDGRAALHRRFSAELDDLEAELFAGAGTRDD